MKLTGEQRRRLAANAARDKAEALLERLIEAREESDRCATTSAHAPSPHDDGARHALERAITSTRDMIEKMNREIG